MVKTAKNRQKNTHFYVKKCVFNYFFGNKVTSVDFSYRNSMRYSILVEIIQAKIILNELYGQKDRKA